MTSRQALLPLPGSRLPPRPWSALRPCTALCLSGPPGSARHFLGLGARGTRVEAGVDTDKGVSRLLGDRDLIDQDGLRGLLARVAQLSDPLDYIEAARDLAYDRVVGRQTDF